MNHLSLCTVVEICGYDSDMTVRVWLGLHPFTSQSRGCSQHPRYFTLLADITHIKNGWSKSTDIIMTWNFFQMVSFYSPIISRLYLKQTQAILSLRCSSWWLSGDISAWYPQGVSNLDGHIIWLNIGDMGVSTKMGVHPIAGLFITGVGNIGHHLIVAIIDHIPIGWVTFNGDI